MIFRFVCLIVLGLSSVAVRAECRGAVYNPDGSVTVRIVARATPTPTPPPPASPTPTPLLPGFYVATSGSPVGNGSINNPWDLRTALNQTRAIRPGSIVYLRGGTYFGKFTNRLTGVVVRSYPGEWARIDGNVHSTLAAAMTEAAAFSDSKCVFTSNLELSNGAAIWIEDEMVSITGQRADGLTWNCQRGWGGTLVAAHPAGALAYSPDEVMTIVGSGNVLRDMEILDSSLRRLFDKDLGNTTIGYRSGGIVVQNNTGTKLINLIIHDTSTGVFANESAVALEIYGTIVFNNGFVDWSRGHGQGFYLANDPVAQKTIRDVISFNGFSDAMKAYTSSGKASNFLFDGVIAFNAGVNANFPGNHGNGGTDLLFGHRDAAIFVGANGPNKNTDNIIVRRSYLYEPPNSFGTPTLWTGYAKGVGSGGLEVSDSRIMGGANSFAMAFKSFSIMRNKFHAQGAAPAGNDKLLVGAELDAGYSGTWDQNSYFDETPKYPFPVAQFPFIFTVGGSPRQACVGGAVLKFSDICAAPHGGWQQVSMFDAHSTYVSGPPTLNEVFVIPNDYEPGRAHIAIYNYALNPTVNVDISFVTGLRAGDRFEVRAVEDFFGTPVLTGIYSGSPIAVPMTGKTVAPAIGLTWAPPSTRPRFGAFVLTKK